MAIYSSLPFKTGLLSAVFLAGSAHSGELRLSSNEPGATVYEVSIDEGAERVTEVGKTPLVIQTAGSTSGRTFKIEKQGFSPVYLPVLGNLAGTHSIRVQIRRATEWAPKDIEDRSLATAEKLVDEILSVQLLLDQKNGAEALARAETLRASHPASLSVRLVYANALLVSGAFDRARQIYHETLQELPESRAALRTSIRTILDRIGTGRSPASKKTGDQS